MNQGAHWKTETKGSSTANGPFTDARASPLTLCWRGANLVVDPPKIPDLAPPDGRRELNVGSVEMTNWRLLSRLSAKLSAAEYWRRNAAVEDNALIARHYER
ncbi:hypothetical protein CGLO_03114 [Colletotrichum gloeosporioides Cg-14]|uniref:Uncharacterized protein n=1 Tax=Colletotrichum gloeosporioides (strain Cg-14) TaxID=1237896 RepID=T0KMI7_COLGC|nr:hypothetical protein CGLO_03114 [Colletotrichum gloeosporioides Cg-14]